ncbi:MAG: glycosyl hydrolase 115 family protein, partial [Thermoguttaceae bacterium]
MKSIWTSSSDAQSYRCWFLLLAAGVLLCAGTPREASSAPGGESGALVLEGSVTIANTVGLAGVRLAAVDLASDLEKVLSVPAGKSEPADARIVITLDGTLAGPEAYRIETDARQVRIRGADELGVIYGIYRFSRECLGVDPYWYFKDLLPEQRGAVTVPPGVVESRPSTFGYRGWFVNDEDLLTEWKEGGGARHIDYPFYQQVVHPDVIDRVFEALLRAGGNLVIPASFVDVMNEPEAALIRRAVERGLYVTQHHIEPLGVSHYGFENYWKARGRDYAFAYGSQPDQVREAWRAFAQRWYELAGSKVVWQLGLRGKGDRAIWLSDKSVGEAEAGRMISR